MANLGKLFGGSGNLPAPEHLSAPSPAIPEASGEAPAPDVPPRAGEPPSMLEQLTRYQLETLEVLRRMASTESASPVEIAVTDEASQPQLLQDFPVPGAKRWLIPRTATGGDLVLPEGLFTDVLPPSRSRIGGTIVNGGAKDVRLYLAPAQLAQVTNAVASVDLSKNGGSWDFRLGNLLWGGSISAKPKEGESELSIAEV